MEATLENTESQANLATVAKHKPFVITGCSGVGKVIRFLNLGHIDQFTHLKKSQSLRTQHQFDNSGAKKRRNTWKRVLFRDQGRVWKGRYEFI